VLDFSYLCPRVLFFVPSLEVPPCNQRRTLNDFQGNISAFQYVPKVVKSASVLPHLTPPVNEPHWHSPVLVLYWYVPKYGSL
jgi:hypothetical protein